MSTRSLVRDLAFYGSGELLTRASGVITILVLSHFLTPHEYGLLALVTPAAAIFALAVGFGAEGTYSRFFFDPGTVANQAMVTSTWLLGLALIGMAGVVAVLLLLDPISRLLFEDASGHDLVALAAITAPIGIANGICGQALRNRFMPRQFIMLNALTIALSLACLLLFVAGLGWGARGVLLATLVAAVLLLPIRLLVIRDLLSDRISLSRFREMLGYGAGVALTGLSAVVILFVDRWLIGRMISVAEVGVYAVGASLAAILGLFSSAFGQAWSPHFLNVFQESPEAARQLARRALTVLCGIVGLLAVAAASFAEIALNILAGPAYASAAAVVGPLALAVAISATLQVTAIGISIRKLPRFLLLCTLVTAVFGVAVTVVGILIAGVAGAAWAAALTQLFLSSVCLFVTQKLWWIPIDYGRILPLFGLTVLCIAIAEGAISAGLPAQLIVGVLLTGGYLVIAMRLTDLSVSKIMTLVGVETR